MIIIYDNRGTWGESLLWHRLILGPVIFPKSNLLAVTSPLSLSLKYKSTYLPHKVTVMKTIWDSSCEELGTGPALIN